MVGGRSATAHGSAGRYQDRRIAASLVRTRLHGDPIAADDRRYGVREPIWRDDRRLSEDVAADRQAGWSAGGHHAPCAAPQLRQSCGRSRVQRAYHLQLARAQDPQHHQQYVHSADAVLLAAADAVASATMKLMTSDQPQPHLRDQQRDGSVVWDDLTSL